MLTGPEKPFAFNSVNNRFRSIMPPPSGTNSVAPPAVCGALPLHVLDGKQVARHEPNLQPSWR
jgi:hypothetical protein